MILLFSRAGADRKVRFFCPQDQQSKLSTDSHTKTAVDSSKFYILFTFHIANVVGGFSWLSLEITRGNSSALRKRRVSVRPPVERGGFK